MVILRNMKKLGFFLVIFFVASSFSIFSKNELQVAFDLIEEFDVRQCIFVGGDDDLFSEIKTFSSKYIPSIYMNYDKIIKFVDETNTLYYHVGIIFKEKDLAQLELISTVLDKLVGTCFLFCQFLIHLINLHLGYISHGQTSNEQIYVARIFGKQKIGFHERIKHSVQLRIRYYPRNRQ